MIKNMISKKNKLCIILTYNINFDIIYKVFNAIEVKSYL